MSSFRSSLAGLTLPTTSTPIDWRAVAAWLLGAGLAQGTLLHFFAIRGAVPSLIFIVVATYATRSGIIGAILLGTAGGLLDDALAGNTGAAWTIATAFASLAVALSARVLFTDSMTIFSAIVTAGVLVREGAYWAVISFEGYPTGLGAHYAKLAVLAAAYTGLVVLVSGWARWRFQPSR